MRWVRENDSALSAFWQSKGDSVLWLLAQFSGLDWVEDRFDIYILKYYPSFGGADPLVIPLAGKREASRIVAAPEGAAQKFNLIYRLAHRMLIQAEKADDPSIAVSPATRSCSPARIGVTIWPCSSPGYLTTPHWDRFDFRCLPIPLLEGSDPRT